MMNNIRAWEKWITHIDILINVNPHTAGVIFTLNLDFLRFLFENEDVGDRMIFYRKIKALFDVWREFQEKKDNSKTQKSLDRARELQRAR